jgi:hypothetical protein
VDKVNERRGVQYCVGKEGLWPATHAERVDDEIGALQRRVTELESAHQALLKAVRTIVMILEKESPL